MPVDVSSPVPDELDAKVEQMLRHVDKVHAEVVNRLDSPSDEERAPTASAGGLDQQVDRALRDAAEAARTVRQPAAPAEVPVERPAASASATPAPVSAPVPSTTTPTPSPDVSNSAIKELDTQLAAAADDDDFADGSSMVEGQSLDVPLPESSPLGELPAVKPPAEVVASVAVSMPPVEPTPKSAAAPTPVAPAPAPVKPAPAPAVKHTQAPVSKPAVAPVVIPKPQGPTMADHFWRVATPVMEPIAVRLGKLPVGFQHTVGWIGIVTLFMAAATWGFVFFFQETRPASHLPVAEQSGEIGSTGGEKGAVAAGGEKGHEAPKGGSGRH